ncbi:MAG TPA: hypothetical protein VMG40_05420 [Bryobacteraceae bacterium]|nr:hypothetical protein [Bryobacteraceae bacterium]
MNPARPRVRQQPARLAVPLTLIAILLSGWLFAQRTMTVAELSGFIRSSVENKLDDKDVAEVLKKIQLSERLDQKTLGELLNLGAGPRTSLALRELSDTSASLPAPAAAAAPAPKPRPVISTLHPTAEQQSQILDGIREYALNYTQGLPNFICNQVTHRNVDPTGTGDHFREMDKLQEQLTYFEHHENYKVVAINGQLVNNKDHLKLGGAISEGEFGSMMYEIFAPYSETEFTFDHVGTWDGQRVNEFRYHIPQERSHYQITAEDINRTIIAGYHGMVIARADSSAVMRITLETEEIPADFPIHDVTVDLRYDIAKISDQPYMVPVKWEMRSRDRRSLVWNWAEFVLYRKFETTSTLKFDSDDSTDNKKEEPKPPVKKQP